MYDLKQNKFYTDSVNDIFFNYINNIKEQAIVLVVNNVIYYTNDVFIDISGYDRKEIVGSDFINIIPEYFHGNLTEIKDNLSECNSQDLSVLCSNNKIKKFKIKGKKTIQNNEEVLFIGMSENDIEEIHVNPDLKLYHSILSSITENIFVIDNDLNIIQTIKVKSEKFTDITNLSDSFSARAIKNILKNSTTVIKNNTTTVFEIHNYKSYYEAKLVPYKDNQYVFAFSEISIRKRIENKLIDSQIQLKQLNNEKDLLLSIIAHDLKNPFNIINGFCSVLLNTGKKFNSEKKNEIIEHIYTASISGHNLLVNLLEWSRSQSERILFSPVNINLKEIINHIIGFYSFNVVNKKIKLENEIQDSIRINADKNMLSTILRNLISNAIKYTKVNGTICLKAVSKNNHIEVTVKDNGVGLSEKQINNLFKIGKNYSTTGTSGEKGTGLGLLLCKDFIEKHKGKIWVTSSVDSGSEFVFTLPVAKE